MKELIFCLYPRKIKLLKVVGLLGYFQWQIRLRIINVKVGVWIGSLWVE